jgi:hypothetical protein
MAHVLKVVAVGVAVGIVLDIAWPHKTFYSRCASI